MNAQQLRGDLIAQTVEHRVLYGGSVFTQTGTWIGLRAEVSLRRFRFEVSTVGGKLGGDSTQSNPDRDARTTLVSARWRALPWLEVGPSAEARRFATGPASTTWRVFGLTVRAETDLGLSAVHGTADLSVFPVGSGTHVVAPSSAVRAAVGIEVAPSRSPFVVRLAYRFERFSMDDPVVSDRREQFDGLQLGAGVRLRR